MRHLSTEELLLYAEGELEERELCQHVAECVDCKARIVDLQETFVYAASEILGRTHDAPSAPMRQFRARLAEEAQLLAAHLSTEDLLLSVEDSLKPDEHAHLQACSACRDRAADLHVQLMEIEYELHRRTAYHLPAERRAAAMATLRARLEREVRRKQAEAARWFGWLPAFGVPRMPAFASYAAAVAAACLVAWVGWNAVTAPPAPAPDPVAAVIQPATTSVATAAAVPEAPGAGAVTAERFEAVAHRPPSPQPVRALDREPAPVLEAPALLADSAVFGLPSLADLPAAPAEPGALQASAVALPLPGRIDAPVPDAPESAVAGAWMLARTGMWKEPLQAGGPRGIIRFTGSLPSEEARSRVERALRAVANGRHLEFALSVRASRDRPAAGAVLAKAAQAPPAGGLARSALVQHYEDSARRSFLTLAPSLLENEINRYVAEVMSADTELLAHVHALHGVLNRAGIDEARHTDDLRRVARFHLDAISRLETTVYSELSEALPRSYWSYRSAAGATEPAEGLGATSRELLRDALALDRALTAMFFDTGAPLDLGAGPRSVGTLLASVRQHARRLKAAIR